MLPKKRGRPKKGKKDEDLSKEPNGDDSGMIPSHERRETESSGGFVGVSEEL